MTTDALEFLTAKSILTFTINILQPCNKNTLETNLKKDIDSNLLDTLLAQLLEEKRATREGDYFRLTVKGMNSIIPGKGRILRDLHRMQYLFELSAKGGGA
jgi:hypothetical protein